MTNYVDYRAQTSNGPSFNIWCDCPVMRIVDNASYGYGMFDDFIAYDSTATGVQNASGLPVFEGSCTLNAGALVGGVLQMFGTADNEEASLQHGGDASAPFVIPAASADGKKLWFECRVKKSVITDAYAGFFVGLASEGAGVADFIADAGNDFADVDLIGFWNDETDDSLGSHVHVICQKTGAAFDTIIDTAATLVADTYVKLGFVYDPSAPTKKRIKFYVDGVEQTTYVGEASADATVYITDTTNFPGGEEMSPLLHLKQASANDVTISMDWWRCYQER